MKSSTTPRTKSARLAALRLDNQLCFALYSASLTMTKLYKPLLAQLGLTYPQYLVMLVLWEQDNQTVSEIGEKLYLDSGTLTPLLKRIETLGLLQRQRNANDERQVAITLTASGLKLRDAAMLIPDAVASACSVTCSMSALQTMTQDLQRLRLSLAQNLP